MPVNIQRFKCATKISASPGQRVVMVYEAIGKNIQKSIETFDSGASASVEGRKHQSLSLAENLIKTLQQALDQEKGGDMARTLDELYDSWLDKIADGKRENDPTPLREVLAMVNELTQSWRVAAGPGA